MKRINVVLAFHAQEPLWDLPARVIETLRDETLREAAVGNDNWVRRRAEEDRDIYRDLLRLGERLGAPMCLEATNEILMQIRRYMPETFDNLGAAYRSGAIYPIYGNAFHTHIAMITADELADEIRLNREYLRDALGAPSPRHAGAFPMEGSIDARKLAGFVRAGMEYVIFPNLSERKMRYRVEGLLDGEDATYGALAIGDDGLLALPRHFPVSQEIWRPITRWQPDRLKPQGYILGKFPVLDEEYRSGASVPYPIERPEAVAAYIQTLRDAIAAAPDGALLLYIQDLELMDFGEEALDILGEAWEAVRAERAADVRFITPDGYIDDVRTNSRPLPRLRFHQASWAPEIRLVLRSDGHYPPLHAGPYRGVDNDEAVFRRWPFIFWEPGRFIADTLRALVTGLGHDVHIPLTGVELDERGYALDDALPLEAKLAIHLRAVQRACNFGWQPDEDRHKWPYMHGVAICELLREELKTDGARGASLRPLPERALEGLDRVLAIIVDTRVAYLRAGIVNLGERAGDESRRAAAERHLRAATAHRQRASALARTLRSESAKLLTSCPVDARAAMRLLALAQEHCKEAFLSVNEIQRAWMCIEDTAGMIEEMYAWLHDVYPPRFPDILREMLTAEELAAVDDPELV